MPFPRQARDGEQSRTTLQWPLNRSPTDGYQLSAFSYQPGSHSA
jgi:hypothetical protein